MADQDDGARLLAGDERGDIGGVGVDPVRPLVDRASMASPEPTLGPTIGNPGSAGGTTTPRRWLPSRAAAPARDRRNRNAAPRDLDPTKIDRARSELPGRGLVRPPTPSLRIMRQVVRAGDAGPRP